MTDPTRPWIEPSARSSPPAPPEPERVDEAVGGTSLATDRRGFLKLAGIGAAASLASCKRLPVEQSMPYLVPPEEVAPGIPVRYASTCTACPASCGLLVACLDGRPVKLEGKPDHPISGGGLCALGQGDLRGLYDAGRLRGPRLDGRAAAWEDLDARVGVGLGKLRGGAPGRVAVLTTTIVSPSARDAVTRLLAPFGGRLVEWDAEARPASALLEAQALVHGSRHLPFLELARADLLVSIGADLLGTGWDPVGHTRAWAARRRDGTRGPFRHLQIEGSLTVSGAAADERWTLSSGERRALALATLQRVAAAGDDALSRSVREALSRLVPSAPRAAALATELLDARGRSLVVSGSDDVAEQVAVALLNRLLGNDGATLDHSRPSLVRNGQDGELAALLSAVEAGEVSALFVVGLDPVDQLPGGDRIAAALARLPLAVAVTDRPTATAAACAVVAAAHHGLESWADAEPRAGLLTLAQPAVRPLFDTRHPWESVLRWSGTPAGYRAHLEASVRRRLGSPDGFDALFTDAIRRAHVPLPLEGPARTEEGVAEPSPEALRLLATASAAAPAAASGLEVELIAEVGVRDGSRAHVPWLRELPDPLTRVSWTPCARLAPDTARELGIADGDVVTVDAGSGRAVTLPARIQPGQHRRVVGVPVGYGRLDGDGGDPSRNGYRLAALGSGRLATAGLAATVSRTGQKVALPLLQPTGQTHDRPVVRQAPARDARLEKPHQIEAATLWPARKPTSPKWEMVIDLDACTGCGGCVVACQAENNLPVVGADEVRRSRDMYWLRVDRYFLGDPAEPDVVFEPMLCAQCDNAPCETVCPVAATVHSEDGLNQQVYNRCVGTRYCANNCPYKARRFNWFDYPVKEPLERLVLNPNVVVRSRGVMEKCTFCVQRIQAARIASRKAGQEDWRGGGVQTACQQSCPARAISFGDGTDGGGEVARQKASPRAFQVLDELGIGPAVTYLAKVRSRRETPAEGGHAS